MSERAASISAHGNPVGSKRSRWQSPQTTQLTIAVRYLLRGTAPVAQPMISRAGIRAEAHRVRAILRATMKDQQIGGK
jgi:hypothetical protein